jgi:hypothetical protein
VNLLLAWLDLAQQFGRVEREVLSTQSRLGLVADVGRVQDALVGGLGLVIASGHLGSVSLLAH